MARVEKKPVQSHKLTEEEANYLQMLNRARIEATLIQHTNMSGFMSYIAKTRLGYPEVEKLQFEYDPEAEEQVIKISVID